MFVSRQWVFNILISFLLLTFYTKCGSKAEDLLSDTTFEPDTFVPFRLQTFTTEESSTFIKRKDVYQEPGNLNEIGSKSNVVNDVQKLNNDAIYKDSILDGRNQVQEQQNIQSSLSSSQYQKDQSPLEYVTTNHSENSRERVMNHRITAFEKHKAHQRNYRRYGHKSNGGHKKNYSKYKKFEHERYKTKQKSNGYNNRQSPYYQSQLSYYNNESDGVDNPFELSSLSEKSKNHRYHHQHHHHHYHHQHHNHHHSNHNRKTDEYSQSGKWPHLSRVQYQLYEDEKEEDLPPYIKKYKRRNKQLLDLLEGTIPPPLPLQSTESSIPFKKRKKSKHHYHNHKNPKWIVEDLFEEQKANPNNPNIDDDQYVNDAQSISVIDSLSTSSPTTTTTTTTVHPLDDTQNEELKSIQQNELPGYDISVSSEEDNNNKISEKGTNNMILSKIDKQKSYEQSLPVISTEQPQQQQQQQRYDISQSRTNKFIYHRIDTAPRVVGAGTSNGSRKQRLPFVAITDRRLETSKTRQRDFEKNHLPMP